MLRCARNDVGARRYVALLTLEAGTQRLVRLNANQSERREMMKQQRKRAKKKAENEASRQRKAYHRVGKTQTRGQLKEAGRASQAK